MNGTHRSDDGPESIDTAKRERNGTQVPMSPTDPENPITIFWYGAVTVAIALLTVDALTEGLPPHMETLLIGAVFTALLTFLARHAINAGRKASEIRAELGEQEANA